jgi:hypothetical protein
VRFEGAGSFIMNNSVIRENSLVSSSYAESDHGGGVGFVNTGTGIFVMNNSVIEDNEGSNAGGGGGGGVACSSTGTDSSLTVTMNDSVIQNNTGFAYGGGVYVFAYDATATFTMKGESIISGNSVETSGNYSDAHSGGVYVCNATFKKEPGAIVYGSDGSENSNTAAKGSAIGVYTHTEGIGTDEIKKREITAGADISLSAVYSEGSYSFEGSWEE